MTFFRRIKVKTLAEEVKSEIDLAEHNLLYHYQEREKHDCHINMYNTRIARLKNHATQRTTETSTPKGGTPSYTGAVIQGGLSLSPDRRSLRERVDRPEVSHENGKTLMGVQGFKDSRD